MAGDFNLYMLETNPRTRRLFDIIKNWNLNLHIAEPTRGKSSVDPIIRNIHDVIGSIFQLWLSDYNTAQLLKFKIGKKKLLHVLTKDVILTKTYGNLQST